jgi:hypothetical protein
MNNNVEYGKLKMALAVINGLLSPFQLPIASHIPDGIKLAAACVQGASNALFLYLLKPASQDKPK